MVLKELPFDIYVQILKRLPVSAHSNEGPRTLVACLQVNSILQSAASISTIWEPHYRVRYTVSRPTNELSRRQALCDDWKSLYMERVRLDNLAIKILDDIIMERDGRLERAREVTSTLSHDVWNALAAEAQCPIPEPFRGVYDSNEGQVPRHAIPRRFWARSLLGTIARSHAVKIWSGVGDEENNDAETLEVAIACLSSYFARPPTEISSRLDVLGVLCRSYLEDKNLPINPLEFNHDESTLRAISISICDFLWEHGFRAAEHTRFNAFNTRFPHWFLTTHKDTIPISLVYIFVCLARRLGISAAPVDFPARVLVIVSSPDPAVLDIIVDVFGSRSKAILSLQEDIPRLLVDVGLAPLPLARYTQPATTASMVVRASRNILASFSFLPPMEIISEGDLHTAYYVGLTVNLIFMNDRRYLLNIMKLITHFPLDILSVLTDALAPSLRPPIQAQLLANCKAAHEDEDEASASVTLRSKQSTRIQHFVGMIFRHVKYEYIGYIYGWEPSCMAPEGWITSMNIDSLPRGRHQPFYNILTQSGSVRYVAEENIEPTTLKPYAYRQLLENASEAGRYFEGLVQANERARLLLSPELLFAYPEDNAVGEMWIKDGKTD
ncbi:YccV-like-domain-containing protein [Boletus edulis BED1]|uniref:YccV-like-domain-containing protein n=1 Tax=Boletus edulis BED1 TaxID=1328754 RepID=A0AAD4C0M0_BOLED|nr:YccV-like-domain-containing protein [Boletus edulis BED1]